MRRLTLLKVQLAIKPTAALKTEMALVEAFFLSQNAPQSFNPHNPGNVVMKMEQSFEEVCVVMQENGMAGPKRMTEYEFYSTITYFHKKYENLNK